MKDKIIAKVAENLPSLITDIKTICNYDSRRDTATEKGKAKERAEREEKETRKPTVGYFGTT